MASLGQQVHCAGDRCNKMVFIEPNKPPLCQLHARAVKDPQALARLKEAAEVTQRQQLQARYKGKKWQKEMERRRKGDLKEAVRAQEAQAAARAMPPLPAPRERFGNGRPTHRTVSGSSDGGHSPAPDRPNPEDVYSTISRAMAQRASAPSGSRRLSKEDSFGPGNKVSKTGRARQAGFLTAIDDHSGDLPENPIGSMAPPPRPSKHKTDKHKEKITHYDDYNDDNDRPINTIHSIRPRPLPDNERPNQGTETLTKLRLNRLNHLGGIPDSDEKDEPVDYEDTRRSMRKRFLKPRKSVPMAQHHINTTRDAKRPNDEDDSDQQSQPKRSRFKPDVLAQLSKAENAPAPNQKKTWAVPKTVKSMLPPPEIFADEDQLAQLPVDNLGLLGMSANGSGLPRGYGSYAASEGGMSQQTVPLGEKISMWHGIKVAGDVHGSSMQAMSQILSPAPVAQSVAQTEGTIIRLERGTAENKGARRRPQTPPKRDFAHKKVPVVLLRSYKALDASDSGSSTSSSRASGRSVNNNVGAGAFNLLQSLPKALKKGTLKSSTPQKGSKHGTTGNSKNNTPATVVGKSQSKQHKSPKSIRAKVRQKFLEPETDSYKDNVADEELPTFALDYPQENGEERATDDQMFDLLKAMDSEGNVVNDQAMQSGGMVGIASLATNKTALQTISAKALRAREGLPADSPINEQLMLDLATKVQHGALDDTTTTREEPDEGEAALEHELTIDEFEMKKKKFDEEREKLMKMIQRGEDATKQKMVVRLWEKKLDEFVAGKGLRYKKAKMFE